MAAADETQEQSDRNDTSVKANQTDTSKGNALKLKDLKVSELKVELEKRDLDKNGVKSVLVERLKTAILEEGEDPEEYNFETSSEAVSTKTVVNEKIEAKESVETNGTIESLDEMNNSIDEKHDETLQLSIDEEEAQLNDESLIEVSKQSEIESKKVDEIEVVKEVSTSENSETGDQSTPSKVDKENSQEVETVKTPVVKKNTESISAVPKKSVGKSDKPKTPTVLAKSLWITGLPNTTRVADLTAIFSKQGRVLSAKIVKSAKQTPGKCYGFVTMATSRDATKAIQVLHRTELNGRVISVERRQNEPSTLIKKSDSKTSTSTSKKITPKKEETSTKKQVTNEVKSTSESKDSSKAEKKAEEKKTSSESSGKKPEKTSSPEKSKDRKSKDSKGKDTARSARRPVSTRPRTYGNDRPRFSNFRRPFQRRPFSNQANFRPRPNAFSAQRIREERFQRERLRERREAERRRLDDLTRHRFIERKQRDEAYRLEREKERLRIERELLERERAEIIRLEREKQRLERERLEQERDLLRRQVEIRRAAKRPFSRVDRDADPVWEERKKPVSRYDARPPMLSEAPSSSRFEFPARERSFPLRDRGSFGREYDRHADRFNSPKNVEVLPRSDFGDRDARREITISGREERQIFSRSDFRDRDNRRTSLPSREPERTTRREVSRSTWKQDRRVHERVPSSGSSGQRRLNYF